MLGSEVNDFFSGFIYWLSLEETVDFIAQKLLRLTQAAETSESKKKLIT